MPPLEHHNPEQFAQYLETLGLDLNASLPRETLRDKSPVQVPAGGYELPRISFTQDEQEQAELTLHKLLGVGGMGEVWEARQVPLRRTVAVKRLHPKATNPATIRRNLLREAWTAGRLEHPNIAPIHALGVDEEGQPLLVMKMINGSDWRELIYCPWMMPQRYQGRPTRDVHLEIFMKVCDAVHFAHTRGVIHRDLKPENVMVGEFGEVYLLDWGIAVGLDDTQLDGIPMASAVTTVAGTPGYMSPEMVYLELGPLGTHSDVYCLGAVLHEVLTGTIRHPGKTAEDVFLHTFNSEPVRYDANEVPKRLAEICNRATALEPSQRYPSADALRLDVQHYLVQRQSLSLLDTALERVAVLKNAIKNQQDHLVGGLYGAADFGFRQSLEVWPDNTEALQAYEALLLLMTEFEIKREQPAMGRLHLENISSDNTNTLKQRQRLSTQLDALENVLHDRAKLERELDLRVYTRRRALFALLLFFPIFFVPLSRYFNPPTTQSMMTGQMFMCLFVFTLIWLSRKWLLATKLNSALAIYLGASTTLVFMLRLLAWMRDIPMQTLAVLEFVLYIAIYLFISLLADSRLTAPIACLAIPLLGLVLAVEGTEFLASAIFNGGGILIVVFVWYGRGRMRS